VAYGCESTFAPQRLDRWPVIAAFFLDPDGYLVELIQHVTD
jgi:catechol 2,3-dioxygenase-like lactoylglutathione lyase family enzyme